MVRAALALALFALAGCSGPQPQGRVPSYRVPFVNSSANSTYEPPNSLPR